MKILFLCGCETGNVEHRSNLETMDSIGYDAEGMMICGIHGARRAGWRSLPQNGPYANYSFAGLHPAVIEGIVVFGEFPPLIKLPPIHSTEPDRRDNRDPKSLVHYSDDLRKFFVRR